MGVFIFPPHLFSSATLPREIVKTQISAKIKQNHENFTEVVILTKNLYLSKQYGARTALSELPDKGWKLDSINSLLKRIRVQLSGNQAAVDRVRRVAVEDLVLSQEDKPKRHRSTRQISHETVILYSSVHRKIIHRDLQLTCFKRCRAQLLSEANRISRLTRL